MSVDQCVLFAFFPQPDDEQSCEVFFSSSLSDNSVKVIEYKTRDFDTPSKKKQRVPDGINVFPLSRTRSFRIIHVLFQINIMGDFLGNILLSILAILLPPVAALIKVNDEKMKLFLK